MRDLINKSKHGNGSVNIATTHTDHLTSISMCFGESTGPRKYKNIIELYFISTKSSSFIWI